MKCSKPNGTPEARDAIAAASPAAASHAYELRQRGSVPARRSSPSWAPETQMFQYFAKLPIGHSWPPSSAAAPANDVSATHASMRAVPTRRQNQSSSGYIRYSSASTGSDHSDGFADSWPGGGT